MSTDHFHINITGETITFDKTDYTKVYIVPFYLSADSVYIGSKGKADSGTIYCKFIITDSASSIASGENSTSETSWQEWTGDTRLEIDCSSLLTGEGTLELQVKGIGQCEIYYFEQE